MSRGPFPGGYILFATSLRTLPQILSGKCRISNVIQQQDRIESLSVGINRYLDNINVFAQPTQLH